MMTPRRLGSDRAPGGVGVASTWKWLGLATAAALLVGTTPAAGQVLAMRLSSTVDLSPVSPQHLPPVTVPGNSAPNDLDPATAALWTEPGWSAPYTREITSDGSAANGESVSGGLRQVDLAGIRRGLLPGNLALTPPVAGGTITSPYGWRLNPTGPGSYIHIGQDYGVPCGTPVRAAEAGVVVQSAWAGHSGQRIRVDHGSGVETAYSHNSLLVAKVGDRVQRGSLLALSGTSGNSTGCHVHFEVYLNGTWVNPALYLPAVPGAPRLMTPDEMLAIARSKSAGPATTSRDAGHQHDADGSAAARSGSPAAEDKAPSARKPEVDFPATTEPRTSGPKAPPAKRSPAPRDPAPRPPKTAERTAPATPDDAAETPTEPSTPPAAPSTPAEPSDPATPPAAPSTPAEPSQPVVPAPKSGDPAEPSDPTTPPAEPSEPTEPTTNPSAPTATPPAEPSDPTTPPAETSPATAPPTEPGTEPDTEATGAPAARPKASKDSGAAPQSAQQAAGTSAAYASVASFERLCVGFATAAKTLRTASITLDSTELALLRDAVAGAPETPGRELPELENLDETTTVGDAAEVCAVLFEDSGTAPAAGAAHAGK